MAEPANAAARPASLGIDELSRELARKVHWVAEKNVARGSAVGDIAYEPLRACYLSMARRLDGGGNLPAVIAVDMAARIRVAPAAPTAPSAAPVIPATPAAPVAPAAPTFPEGEGDLAGTSELAYTLYERIRSATSGGVGPDEIVTLVSLAMEGVAHVGWLSGPQKKALVLRIVARAARDIPHEGTRAAVLASIALLGPAIVDGLYSAATQGLDVVARRGGWRACLGCR